MPGAKKAKRGRPKRGRPKQAKKITIRRSAYIRGSYKRKGHYRTYNGKRVYIKPTVVRKSYVPATSYTRAGPRTTHKPNWIRRKGKLGGRGFATKPVTVRHRLLDDCVHKYNYRSCLGSVRVLEIHKKYKNSPRVAANLLESRTYLKNSYGGKGSFGPRKPRGKKNGTRKPRGKIVCRGGFCKRV